MEKVKLELKTKQKHENPSVTIDQIIESLAQLKHSIQGQNYRNHNRQ